MVVNSITTASLPKVCYYLLGKSYDYEVRNFMPMMVLRR